MNFEKPSVLDNQQPASRKKKNKELDKLNKSGPFRFTEEDLGEIEEWEEKKKRRVEKKNNEDRVKDPSKRKFLKWGIATAGAAVTGSAAWKGAEWLLGDEEKVEEKIEDNSTVGQEQIKKQDIKSISEILDYNKEGRIEFNMKTVEALRNYWYKQYKENPDMVNSFKDGFKEMGAWKPYLQAEFGKAGWSQTEAQELMYLAMVESFWDPKAMSKDSASGPYQIIPPTARLYGLKSGYYRDEHSNIDERRDPTKSANACARLLKDLYRSSGGDRDLALSGYNGRYIWDYIKAVRKHNKTVESKANKKGINYVEFTEFLEEKINNLRDRIKNTIEANHKVSTGQSLTAIAKKYRKSINELQVFNSLEDPNDIKVGQILKIPISEKVKEKKFNYLISDYSQNLVYPAKFDAVTKLIKEGFVEDQKASIKFKKIISKRDKPNQVYVFKRSDGNIVNIGRKFKINYKNILKANPSINPSKLRGGEKIIIPKSPAVTLESISRKYAVSLDRLRYLNPSIKKTGNAIPDGYEIRI